MSFEKVSSPHEIMKSIIYMQCMVDKDKADNIASQIGERFLKQGWYFTWCQQKWENENASQT